MSEVRISNLPTAASVADATIIPVVANNITSKVTGTQFKSYITSDLANVATSGSYTDLTDTPAPETLQTVTERGANSNVRVLFTGGGTLFDNENGSGIYTELGEVGIIASNFIEIDGGSANADILIGTTTSSNVILGHANSTVTFTQGSNVNLSNVSVTGLDYSSIENTPALANVATSGSYSDLTGKPNIPTIANRVVFTDGLGGVIGDAGFEYNSVDNILSVSNIEINKILDNFEIRPNGRTESTRIENSDLDNEAGKSGFTVRALVNPTVVTATTDVSALSQGDVGAIMSIRSSGGASRFWVGQGITSTGVNDFYVGETAATPLPWKGAKAVIIASSGEARFDGEVYAFYSDERLKNFEGRIDNALDKVSQLNGYYFTENEKAKELGYDNDQRQVGISAQEVEKVLPEVVAPAPVDPEYKTVKYDKMVPLLIEAIKELKEQNAEMADRIRELEQK